MEISKILLYVSLALTGILAVGVSITNIVFAFKYKEYNLLDNTIIENIDKDLNSGLIDRITLKISCEGDEEEAVLEIWDGTEDISAKNFTIFNGTKFCLKRKKETYKDFLNLKQIIPKDDICPNDYKSCGTIDTLDRKLCVENSYNCPINSLNIELNEIENSELVNNIYSLNKGNKYNIIFLYEDNNDDNKTIISTFKISEGYPCINASERDFTFHRPHGYYTKFNCLSQIKGKYIDERYKKFDKFESDYSELYEQNGMESYIGGKLQDSTRINLYGRPYFGVNNPDSFDYDKIYSCQKHSNNCNFAMRIVSIIQLFIVLTPIGFACKSNGGGGECTDKDITCIAIVFGIIIALGFVTNFIISIIMYIFIQRLKWSLTDIYDMGDEYTNEVIKLINENNSYNYNFSLGIMLGITFIFFFGIISLILYFILKRYYSSLD